MVKLVNQSVPTELRAAYDKLVSPAFAAQQSPDIVRTSMSATVAKRRVKKRGAATDIERVVAMLADAYARNTSDSADVAWRSARSAEIKRGEFPLPWWVPAPLLAAQRLSVAAASIEELPRPTYNYQQSNNRPTITTWQPPQPSTDPIGYRGALSGELFCDESWIYEVAEYRLPLRDAARGETEAIAIVHGTITATSDRRASRPMYSLLTRFEQRIEPSADLTDAPPPIAPATSHYYPFQAPLGVPPYYSSSLERIVFQLPTRTTETATGRTARLTYSVRPMLGHANNNNTEVTTSFDGTAAVYVIPQPRPSTRWLVLAESENYVQQLYLFNPATGELRRWRDLYDIDLPLSIVTDGYISPRFNGGYRLLNTRLWRVFEFDDAPGFTAPTIRPGAAASGYLGFDVDVTATPILYYRATWDDYGALTAYEASETPWDSRSAGLWGWDPPSSRKTNKQSSALHGQTLDFDEDHWIIRDRHWNISATLNIDVENYADIELLHYTDAGLWLALRDQNDEADLFYIAAPTTPFNPNDDPPTITPSSTHYESLENVNSATLGENLYMQREYGAPVALTPTFVQLPFASIPSNLYVTWPPYPDLQP